MHKRTLVFLTTLLAGVAYGGAAHAKPKIAILGLEVIDDGSNDARTTAAAKLLTKELRKEATKAGSKYELAPNSAKDLLEMKLLDDCSDENRNCMAKIGSGLGADRLLYGKLERQADGYSVELKLLDTSTKQMETTTKDTIPFREAQPGQVQNWSRTLYNRLTGVPSEGSIVIRANVQKGTVYLDGSVQGALSAGSAKIEGVTEGSHNVSVESEDCTRYDAEVTLSAGGEEELSVTLECETGGGGGGPVEPPGRPGGIYRILFWTTAVAAGASVAGWTVFGLKVSSKESDKDKALEDMALVNALAMTSVDSEKDACAAAAEIKDTNASAAALASTCDDGKAAARNANIFMATTLVTAAASVFFYYKGYVASKENGTETNARNKKKNDSPIVRVAPAISPDTIGAGLEIQF